MRRKRVSSKATCRTERETGEGDGHLLPQEHRPLGGQQLSRSIPERTIDADVLTNGSDATRSCKASGCRSPAQTSAQEVFLHAVVDPPEVNAGVLLTTTMEQLGRLRAAESSRRIPQHQGALREADLLCRLEHPLLHAVYGSRKLIEVLGQTQRRCDDFLDDISAVSDIACRQSSTRDDEPIGADRPEDPQAELIRTGTVVAVEKDDLGNGVL